MVIAVPRVHNYALEIPFAQGEGHNYGTPRMRLNRTEGLPILSFLSYILSGPNYSKGLSGNTLAEHTMQQPGRGQAAPNVQVVPITSLIPVLLKVP